MPVSRAGSRRLLALATGLALASACGPGPDAAAPLDPAELYAGFAPCDPPPPGIDHDPVEGLVELDGLVVAEVRSTGPITSVTGFVEQTPIELRDAFASRQDVTLLHLEDEGYEAEALVERGDHRTFLKATIRCRTGSIVALVVAPAADAGGLPTPGGG